MDEPGIADLKTVVTEACMNVVVHAYEGEPGPLTSRPTPTPTASPSSSATQAPGSGRRPTSMPPSLRLGLSLIAALSSSFAISGGLDRGTEVEMRLPLHGRRRRGGRADPVEIRPTTSEARRRSSPAARSCLPRCWPASSAPSPRAATSPSTASPTRSCVTDAIAAAAPGRFADGRVRLGLEDAEGGDRAAPRADGGRRAPSRSARSCGFRTSAARSKRSPTSSASRASEDGEYLADPLQRLLLLLLDLLPDPGQRPAQDPRDVHLRVADPLGDLRLGHVVDEAQAQDQPLALVEVG